MIQQKKVPMRMCIGCAANRPKKELVRVLRTPEGLFCLDRTGKKNGRGAYLCPSIECLQKARKAKRLERTFGCEIPAEIYEALQEELKHD